MYFFSRKHIRETVDPRTRSRNASADERLRQEAVPLGTRSRISIRFDPSRSLQELGNNSRTAARGSDGYSSERPSFCYKVSGICV